MLMKYTETELRAEIEKEIATLLADHQPVHPAWLTHKICRRHEDGLSANGGDNETMESEHRAFWRFGGYTTTRKLATICINDLESDDANKGEDVEPFLPGFKLLRPQYVNRRDGVDVMVPTEQMTIEELYAKATQFEKNSVTLAEHARELRRYAAMRQEQASGQ